MKKILALFSIVVCLFLASSCSGSVNPAKDAENFYSQMANAAKAGNPQKFINVVEKYCDKYSSAELVERVEFFQAGRELEDIYWNMDVEDFVDSNDLKHSPAMKRFNDLYKKTKKEARKVDMW